jgi:peptidoglycan/xylan/chitin deacetylase (PgdA/CDA1 family)
MKKLMKYIALGLATFVGLPSICRRLHRREVAILMYHGLVDDDRPAEWTQLCVREFEHQMEHLTRHYSPVSLEQAVDYLAGNGELPDNPVVVTFDDGYRSNYELGLPILKKHGIPATVFITPSLLGCAGQPPRELWFDRVYSLAPRLTAGSADLTSIGLPVIQIADPSDRLAVAEAICGKLKGLHPRERQRVIDELGRAFPGQPVQDGRYQGAKWDQVRNSRPLLTPGAHTINHEILSLLPKDEARSEIVDSKEAIEHEFGASISFFAYPNGRREDFTDETRQLVLAAGFKAALTTIDGLNRIGDDLFQLKRIGIGSDSSMMWFRLAVAGCFVPWHKLTGQE